mmetsp:Transcript_34826/g.69642  ORF Transcript_34826/g.69642 Transcript_34826/m.69642 type:complete len:205 (-) Transcript_34826:246-860(-)
MRLVVEPAPADVSPVHVEVRTFLVEHRGYLVVVLHHGRQKPPHSVVQLLFLFLVSEQVILVPAVGAVAIQFCPNVVEDISALFFLLDQTVQLLCVEAAPVHGHHFLLDLAHNQRSAPSHVCLGEIDIREDVVSNVHYVVRLALEELLDHGGAAPRVDAPLFHPELLPHHAVFRYDLVQRHALGEEGRLARGHDRDIEQIPPRHS